MTMTLSVHEKYGPQPEPRYLAPGPFSGREGEKGNGSGGFAHLGADRNVCPTQGDCEPLSEEQELCLRVTANLERALDERDGMLSPREAAVQLLHEFTVIARAMWPQDKSTQDDLVQEMAHAALRCREPNTPSFYCSLGAWRARDYLRWWLLPMLRATGETEERIFEEIDTRMRPLVARCEQAIAN